MPPSHPAIGGGGNNGGAAAAGSSAGGSVQQPQASAGTNGSLLWAKTQQLPEEAFRQLHSIYGDHFPLEARHHLAGETLK